VQPTAIGHTKGMVALSQPDTRKLDDSFDGRAGFARLPEVANEFDFGPHVPKASFPSDFVKAYAAIAAHEPVDWDGERLYFVARFSGQTLVAMYNGFYAPATMQSQNTILNQPPADASGALLLPPGHCIIGEALEEISECRILLCLDPCSADYGRLFLWRLAYQRWNTGDNASGLAPLSQGLDDFWKLLTTRSEAYAATLGSPHRVIASPKLEAAVEHAARVFAPYRSRVSFSGRSEPSGMPENAVAVLRSLAHDPAGTVSGQIVMAYQWSAHDAAERQAQDDLRALLPTLFRLVAGNDDAVAADLAMALAKLGHGDWQNTWPETEVFAVRHFGMCLFESCFENHGLGPCWQGENPQGMRTALHLPHYLAMLLNAGFGMGPFITRWNEMLAFGDVGATIHAASLRFDVRRDAAGIHVDLPQSRHGDRGELTRLAEFLLHDASFAMTQRLKRVVTDDERTLLTEALSIVV
jgi:hypothetical protein